MARSAHVEHVGVSSLSFLMLKLILLFTVTLLVACTDSDHLAGLVSRPYSQSAVSVEQCDRLSEKSRNSCLAELSRNESDKRYCELISFVKQRVECLNW